MCLRIRPYRLALPLPQYLLHPLHTLHDTLTPQTLPCLLPRTPLTLEHFFQRPRVRQALALGVLAIARAGFGGWREDYVAASQLVRDGLEDAGEPELGVGVVDWGGSVNGSGRG